MSVNIKLELLREAGWVVAVHNDYQQDGKAYTFWLFTKKGRCVKGEGPTDEEALERVQREIASLPQIIVLCGSSRFVDIMAVEAWKLERDEGAITMGLHLLPNWYTSPNGAPVADHHLAEAEGVAFAMDALHLQKIDLADAIYVINHEGYVGNSCRNEIAYARARGIPVRWMYPTNIPKDLQ